ncbi:chaperonin 10-like protein [Hyaloraphidium curvatum]|nr:chaperonin 10-like protein [Hyaloraphidium curvatum]
MSSVPAVRAAFSSSASNYQLVLEAVRTLAWRAAPDVRAPGPDEVLLRMARVGICGSDTHMYQGFIPAEFPLPMGHEGAGYVHAVGSNVTNLRPGDLVAIEPEVYRVPSVTPDPRDPRGMIARYFLHPARLCHRMTVSAEEAAFIEPLAVGVHCAVRGGVGPGTKVVVLGAGPVGLAAAIGAKALGAEWVAMADVSEGRLEVAKRTIPIDRTIHTGGLSTRGAAIRIVETCGFQPKIILDAAGFPTSIDTAMRAVAQFGTISLVGVPPKLPQFAMVQIVTKEISYLGSFAYGPNGEDFARAAELVNSGKANVKPLITDLVTLDDVDGAFKKSEAGGNTVKVMFRLPEEAEIESRAVTAAL